MERIYILAKEDIAISKVIRLAEKDIEDLDQIIPKNELYNLSVPTRNFLEKIKCKSPRATLLYELLWKKNII